MKWSLTKLVILLALAFNLCVSLVRFTNVKCEQFDPDFAVFTKCYLKLMKRETVALNIHVVVYKLPVTNVTYNLSLHRKYSGYRPFLYNHTIDFCEFERNPKKHPFLYLFHQFFIEHTNMNHTCPYNHDIIVKDLVVDEKKLKLLPLPKGEYMFQLKVGAYNDWKADVKANVTIDLGFAE